MLVSLRKKRDSVKILGTVPVRDKLDGSVVAQATMEQTRSGSIVAHINFRDVPVEVLIQGFTIDEFEVPSSDD